MKILLTGHKGFIGQNMLKYLQSNTDWSIDTYDIEDKFQGVMSYDWVIHLGAINDVDQNLDELIDKNYEFSKNLFDECKTFGVNLQYASSASVYGQNLEFTEESPLDPITPYAWSKYLFERHASNNMGGNVVQGFRYFNVYGNHEDHKEGHASPIYEFTKQAKSNGKIKIFDDSHKMFRDFICVDDVCRIHVEFIRSVKESGIWNLGTGKPTSFEKVADHVKDIHGGKLKYIMMPEKLHRSYQYYTCSDNTKLENTIGKQSWIKIKDFLKQDN